MAKLTLSDLASLQNETSAIAAVNDNNDALETALENTLSRDGTSPNSMSANLDMNSNRIINLPEAVSGAEPVRLQDIAALPTFTGSSVVVASNLSFGGTLTGGTYGDMSSQAQAQAGSLNTKLMSPLRTAQAIQNGTFFTNGSTGSIFRSFTAKIKDIVSVKDFGALGTSDECSAAFQAAVDSMTNGGLIFVPRGTYFIATPVTLSASQGITIIGESLRSSYIIAAAASNITIFTLATGAHCLSNLFLQGSGSQATDTITGVSQPAIHITSASVGSKLEHCYIQYGNPVVFNEGTDTIVRDCSITNGLGSLFKTKGTALWMDRTACNQGTPTGTFPTSISAWAGTTGYNIGDVVTVGAFDIQCTVAGTSAGSAPILKTYEQNITDGTVTWRLFQRANSQGMQIDTGASEVHIHQSDFSNCCPTASIQIANNDAGTAPTYVIISNCVIDGSLGSCLDIKAGSKFMITNNEIATGSGTGNAAISFRSACSGQGLVSNNTIFGGGAVGIGLAFGAGYHISNNDFANVTTGISVSANINDFSIIGNGLRNLTTGVTIAAGTSDYYTILGNVFNGTTTAVSDGGTGTHKTVEQNGSIAYSGSVAAASSIKSSSATAGIGYSTGAGSGVTQATNKSTGVTLNTVTGGIILNNAALADNASVSFTVTNSAVAATDAVIVNHSSVGTAGAYIVSANAIAAGSFKITVRNESGGSLSEAIVLTFAIIKGVNA